MRERVYMFVLKHYKVVFLQYMQVNVIIFPCKKIMCALKSCDRFITVFGYTVESFAKNWQDLWRVGHYTYTFVKQVLKFYFYLTHNCIIPYRAPTRRERIYITFCFLSTITFFVVDNRFITLNNTRFFASQCKTILQIVTK